MAIFDKQPNNLKESFKDVSLFLLYWYLLMYWGKAFRCRERQAYLSSTDNSFYMVGDRQVKESSRGFLY